MSHPKTTSSWSQSEIHQQFILALDDAFDKLSATPNFSDDWISCRSVAGTKTQIRQSPMLGNGGSGRDAGGFYLFANRFISSEASAIHTPYDRCSFERYSDFALYTDGNWYDGNKHAFLIAECESNSNELLGELAGLISVRCPHKYLFIDGNDTLNRLNAFCNIPESVADDWADTTYHVIEIPDQPTRPSTWNSITATVESNGDRIRFANAG